MLGKVFKSVIVLNFGLLLGRLSGFIRELFVAATFGSTADADIAVFLMTLPDVLSNVLMSGAFSSVLVPVFSSDKQHASEMLTKVFILVAVVFSAISVLCVYCSELLVTLLAPGFSKIQVKASMELFKVVIWAMPLAVLSGVTTAYLHGEEKFLNSSLGTLIINLTIILGLALICYSKGGLNWLALAILWGGVFRLFSQLFQTTFKLKNIFSFELIKSSGLLVRFVQAASSTSILFLFPIVARGISSNEGVGSFSLMNYSLKLLEFPLALFIMAIPIVLFPKLSKNYIYDRNIYYDLASTGAQIVLVISTLLAVNLVIFCDSYVNIAYARGEMLGNTPILVDLTAIGLMFLPFQGMVNYFNFVFYSKKDYLGPLAFNLLGLAVFIFSYKLGFLGKGNDKCMLGMGIGYLTIWLIQMCFLKFPIKALFNKNFLGVLSISVFSTVYIAKIIRKLVISDYYSLLIAGIYGIVLLLVIAVFKPEVRFFIIGRYFAKHN